MPGSKYTALTRQPEMISLCGTALVSCKSKNSGSNAATWATGRKTTGEAERWSEIARFHTFSMRRALYDGRLKCHVKMRTWG